MSTARDQWRSIQAILGTTQDGFPGPKDEAALARLKDAARQNLITPVPASTATPKTTTLNQVIASSFADPADVAAFRRCKASGKSDQECFKVGDNGIGFTGMFTATEDQAICALPKEVWMKKWGSKENASGKPVEVRYNGKIVQGILGDTMPEQKNITNSAGIDLNPGFAKRLGLTPPFKVPVDWAWLT